jgi:Kdo2-lipid IVA lauroyltransferase/acyltransferase
MKIIKYFFEFVAVISLFCIFKILGLKNASNLGSVLGKIVGPFFRSKTVIKSNIKIGLGDINESNEKELISKMWSNIGRTFAEYIFLKDFRFNKNKSTHIKINGITYLEQIKKLGKPVIFYSGHFANFELMAMELDKAGIKAAAIYRPLNNFFLNPVMEYLRMKYICPIQIPKGRMGMREIIGRIKDGYSIALMMDQRVSEGKNISFFKKPALTSTIPAQLALKYDCELVPIFLERKNNINFELTIHKPYKIEKTGNDEQDTKNIILKINQNLEKMVILNPTQWIWSHNRWK